MKLHLMRTHNRQSRSPQSHGRHDNSSTTNTQHQRRRRSNSVPFYKLLTRCRLPCVRCTSDTASLASDLQYHSLLDTPMYLPGQLRHRQWNSPAGESEWNEGQGDSRGSEEEDQDTDLSLFSDGPDNQSIAYYRRTNRTGGQIYADDEGNMNDGLGQHTTGNDSHTVHAHRSTRLKRINTNFIPLAFNSHRSWLERIQLGNVSTSDDVGCLLDTNESEVSDEEETTDESFDELLDTPMNIISDIDLHDDSALHDTELQTECVLSHNIRTHNLVNNRSEIPMINDHNGSSCENTFPECDNVSRSQFSCNDLLDILSTGSSQSSIIIELGEHFDRPHAGNHMEQFDADPDTWERHVSTSSHAYTLHSESGDSCTQQPVEISTNHSESGDSCTRQPLQILTNPGDISWVEATVASSDDNTAIPVTRPSEVLHEESTELTGATIAQSTATSFAEVTATSSADCLDIYSTEMSESLFAEGTDISMPEQSIFSFTTPMATSRSTQPTETTLVEVTAPSTARSVSSRFAGQVSSSRDSMPESLRFLFQPFTTMPNNGDGQTPSGIFEEHPMRRSSSHASLNGYGNPMENLAVPSTLPCNDSTSSRASSLVNLQQNWYIYDPRLNPLNRQQRLNVQMQWRGVQTALSMPAMIGPPDYEDLSSHNEDLPTVDDLEPPPPYIDNDAELPPPPTYDEAILESMFGDFERGNRHQSYSPEPRITNLFQDTSSLPRNMNSSRDILSLTNENEPCHIMNRHFESSNDDDLDTNVLLSASNDDDCHMASAFSPFSPGESNHQQNNTQTAGPTQGTSPSDALQAGFMCSRGRPAVAWNRQIWGESSNQSNFGINCRLQNVEAARF